MPTDTSQPALMPASHEETSGAKARPEHHPGHHLRRFRFDRPQKIAALLLLLLLAQCARQIARAPLTESDYQYARCGREMWERPSAIAGYFTSCGNIHDGVLAYRMAGLPLTVQRVIAGQSSDTSTWEMRHELSFVRLLLRFPFTRGGAAAGRGIVVGHAAALRQCRRLCRACLLLRFTGHRSGRLATECGDHDGARHLRHHLHSNRRCACHAGTAAQMAAAHRAAGGRARPGGGIALGRAAADAATGAGIHGVSGGAQPHRCTDGDCHGHTRRICSAFCLLRLSSGRTDLLLPFRRRPSRYQHGGGTRASLLFR